ncbi:MAG: hypothetical protein RIE16_06600, partial [Rhodospirillales bacterium]
DRIVGHDVSPFGFFTDASLRGPVVAQRLPSSPPWKEQENRVNSNARALIGPAGAVMLPQTPINAS